MKGKITSSFCALRRGQVKTFVNGISKVKMLSMVHFSGGKLIWLLLIMLLVATDGFILYQSNSLGEQFFEGKGQNRLLM